MSEFLKNLKGLSAEEMQATKEMVANDDEFAGQFKSELDKMDKASYNEAQSLMLGTEPDDGSVPEGQKVANSRASVQDRSLLSQGTDLVIDAAQQIPGIKSLNDAVGSLISGNSIEEEAEENRAIANARRENSADIVSFNAPIVGDINIKAADIAKGVSEGGQFLMGGALLKAVTKGPKVLKAIDAASKASVMGRILSPTAGLGARGTLLEAGLETVRQFDEETSKTFENLAESAGTAAMLTTVGNKFGQVLEGSVRAASKLAMSALSTPVDQAVKLSAEINNKLVKRMYGRGLEKVAKEVDLFVRKSGATPDAVSTTSRTVDNTFDRQVIQEQEYLDILSNTGIGAKASVATKDSSGKISKAGADFNAADRVIKQSYKDSLGDISSFVSKSEKQLRETGDVGLSMSLTDSRSLFERVNSVLDNMDVTGLSEEALMSVNKVKTRLSSVFNLKGTEINPNTGELMTRLSPKTVGVTELRNVLKNMQDIDGSLPQGKGSQVLGTLREGMFEIVEDKMGPEGLAKFVDLNKKSRVLRHASSVMEGQDSLIKEMLEDSGKSATSLALKETVDSIRKEIGLVGAGVAAASVPAGVVLGGASGGALPAGLMTGYAGKRFYKALKNTPQSLLNDLSNVDQAIARSGDSATVALSRLGRLAEAGSNMDSAAMKQVSVRLINAVQDGSDVRPIVDAGLATSELLKRPLKRNTEDTMAKLSDIRAILSVEAPKVLEQLNQAILKNEEIGPIMDIVSKTPAAKEIMEDGMGWDGRVFDEKDKAALEKGVSDQPLITADEKLRMISQLRQGGIIPDLENAPTRRPKKYRKKTNKRPY